MARSLLYRTNLSYANLQNTQWDESHQWEFSAAIAAIAYNPCRSWLAVSQGQVIEFRHIGTGEVFELKSESKVMSLSFSADGHLLASGHFDGAVWLWDLDKRQARTHWLAAHGDYEEYKRSLHQYGCSVWHGEHVRVNSVSLSSDGLILAVGSDDKSVQLRDVSSGQKVGNLVGHGHSVNGVFFSTANNRILVSGGNDHTVRVWDVTSLKSLDDRPLGEHSGVVRTVACDEKGATVASGCGDRIVRLWDVSTRKALGEPLREHEGVVTRVSFSRGGRILASGSEDKNVRLWDVSTPKSLGNPLMGHNEGVTTIAFSPDGLILASRSTDKSVRLWDMNSQLTSRKLITGHNEGVMAISFSPNGCTLASGGRDKIVRLWDIVIRRASGEAHRGHSDGVNNVLFSPDSRFLISGDWDGTVRFWKLKYQKASGVSFIESLVTALSFIPDSRTPASGEGIARLRNVDSPTFKRRKRGLPGNWWDPGHWPSIGALLPIEYCSTAPAVSSVSPDGRILAAAEGDGSLRLWNASSHKALGQR
jgi:WD40 repeat protein